MVKKKAKPNKGGRPPALKELPEGWQDTIIELYSQGCGDYEIMAEIYRVRGSFSKDLFYKWLGEWGEFSDTIKRGRLLSQAWWEQAGRLGLITQGFNTGLWFINMRNRFGWHDKQEQTTAEETKKPELFKWEIKGLPVKKD